MGKFTGYVKRLDDANTEASAKSVADDLTAVWLAIVAAFATLLFLFLISETLPIWAGIVVSLAVGVLLIAARSALKLEGYWLLGGGRRISGHSRVVGDSSINWRCLSTENGAYACCAGHSGAISELGVCSAVETREAFVSPQGRPRTQLAELRIDNAAVPVAIRHIGAPSSVPATIRFLTTTDQLADSP